LHDQGWLSDTPGLQESSLMWADRHSRAAGDLYLAGRGGVEPDRQQRAVIPAGSGTYR